MITEPKWKSYVVETIGPIFTPKLCKKIIDLSITLKKERGKIGHKDVKNAATDETKRQSTISWIEFKKMQPVYDDLRYLVQKINRNNFGFNNIFYIPLIMSPYNSFAFSFF